MAAVLATALVVIGGFGWWQWQQTASKDVPTAASEENGETAGAKDSAGDKTTKDKEKKGTGLEDLKEKVAKEAVENGADQALVESATGIDTGVNSADSGKTRQGAGTATSAATQSGTGNTGGGQKSTTGGKSGTGNQGTGSGKSGGGNAQGGNSGGNSGGSGTTPQKQPTYCTISVTCHNAVTVRDNYPDAAPVIPTGGVILGNTTVQIQSGDTVYDILRRAANGAGVSVDARSSVFGVYVAGIGGLYELYCGSRSGWMYSVNGVAPSTSCGNYTVKSGDVISWYYVI